MTKSRRDRSALRPGGLDGPERCTLYLDTNLLLDFPEVERLRGEHPRLTLVILDAVVAELHGLRQAGESARQASRAALALEPLRRQAGARTGIPLGRSGHLLRFEPGQGNADDLLLARAAAAKQRDSSQRVAIVTRDWGLADRARAANIGVVLVHGTFDNDQLRRAVRETTL